jgi:CubicO group peptidase (beta-lactamase class C family)
MGKGGFSKARIGRLRAAMEGYVERGEVPGLVALVARRGETHAIAAGALALGGGKGGAPARRDSIFRISSMTKPVAAAAAMILVEECKLRLDEPVDRLLPELADRKVLKRLEGPLDDTVPAKRAITLRDLLTFRMGFGMVMAPPGSYPIQAAISEQRLGQGPPRPAEPPSPDEWMRRLGALPLMHQPGERWMYNTGSDVLGVLIARAAGQPFDAFLRERLFAPLGMKDTGFFVPEAARGRFATGYWTNFETGKLELYDAPDGEWSRAPVFPSGGAGLVATADDYLAFGLMLLNRGLHGATRILSRAAIETMTTDQLSEAQKAVSGIVPGYFDSHGWGFGLSVVTRRTELYEPVGRFGWDGGLGTSWYADPREELTGVLMTQRAWTSPSAPPVCRDFWTAAYQALDD